MPKKSKTIKLGADYYDYDYFNTAGCKGWYDQNAFAIDNPFHKQVAKLIVEALDLTVTDAGDKLLEVGCARGNVIYWLNKIHGIDCYGFDLSLWAVNHSHLQGKVLQGDIIDGIPYPEGMFKYMFSRETLEHIDPKFVPAVLEHLYRVMGRGGRGLFCPANNFGDKEAKKQADKKNKDISHLCVQSPAWWAEQFERAGFYVDYKATLKAMALPLPEKFTWTMLIVGKK